MSSDLITQDLHGCIEGDPCPQCGAKLWWCECEDAGTDDGRHLICSSSGNDVGECDEGQLV